MFDEVRGSGLPFGDLPKVGDLQKIGLVIVEIASDVRARKRPTGLFQPTPRNDATRHVAHQRRCGKDISLAGFVSYMCRVPSVKGSVRKEK